MVPAPAVPETGGSSPKWGRARARTAPGPRPQTPVSPSSRLTLHSLGHKVQLRMSSRRRGMRFLRISTFDGVEYKSSFRNKVRKPIWPAQVFCCGSGFIPAVQKGPDAKRPTSRGAKRTWAYVERRGTRATQQMGLFEASFRFAGLPGKERTKHDCAPCGMRPRSTAV
jgi:hypothetical protein